MTLDETEWSDRGLPFLSSGGKVLAKHLDGQKLLDPSNYPPILVLSFKNVSHLFLDISFKCKSGKTSWRRQKWLLLKGYATQHSSEGLPASGGFVGNDDCHPVIKSLIDKYICFHGNATPNNRRLRSPNKINMWCLKNVNLTIRWGTRVGTRVCGVCTWQLF